ncbi:hypothetical protein RSPO_c02896 [Ralstonia solanacearum Po82]|uniref:Uncharacterized protein n=1 Tax=Ralstonia solanacearum (strain Po82) TaxID=1031711 RepID=F6G587_RALS8|nr:hypothetical protein RSPO_c02896 [Ralstonia solanacearum Po82]
MFRSGSGGGVGNSHGKWKKSRMRHNGAQSRQFGKQMACAGREGDRRDPAILP